MARLSRLVVPLQAHYVMFSANDGALLFNQNADYEVMLKFIYEQCVREGVLLHGYALLDTQVHLLLTPNTEMNLSRVMQGLGRSYVRYFNQCYARSGTLWSGRYKSTVVQPAGWVKNCLIYFDFLPVLALSKGPTGEVVSFAGDYEWTSHTHFVGLRVNGHITPHADVWNLGNTPFSREEQYAQLAKAGLDSGVINQITTAIQGGWALGDASFIAEIQAQTHRRVAKAKPGRPPLVRVAP